MWPVSEKYNEEIKAQTRKIYSKIQIDYSDPEIDQGIEIISNENNHTSYPFQIADGKIESNFRYLTLDDSWTLGDNSYGLAPHETEATKCQYGLWGEQLSDANGFFLVPYPKIIMQFISRPIRSLKLVGDSKRNEFAKDFTIKLYRADDTIAHTETVIDNILVNWNKEIEQVNEIVKIEIEITRWNMSNRVIKIMEVLTSIQEIYEGDDIMFIHLLEEKEVTQGSLPIGNITSNELQIKLNNTERLFDAGNKDSNLYGLIKPNRIIRAWIGTKTELVPLGIFWTRDWDVPESDIIATAIGRDRLDRLRDNNYSTSVVQINKNMYELAEMVLVDAGLNDEQYWLDNELKQFTVPYAYFNPVTHREALRQIAMACLGQVYCDREGIIRFEGPSFTLNRVMEKTVNTFLQAEFPAEVEILEGYGISDDDYFLKDNPSRQSNIANHITVETQPLKPDIVQEIYKSNDPLSIKAEGYRNITIFFNEIPCIDVDIFAQGTGEIVETKTYSWGADLKVYSSEDGVFEITALGRPLKVINKNKVIVQDKNSIIDNGIIRYNFPLNHLIQSTSSAETIANLLLQYYKDPKRDLVMDWRGNPALELNDIIVVDDYARGQEQEPGYYYITKQELEYNGGLRAKLEGRRAL